MKQATREGSCPETTKLCLSGQKHSPKLIYSSEENGLKKRTVAQLFYSQSHR